MTVQRYDDGMSMFGFIDKEENGRFVLYSDFESVCAERDAAVARASRAESVITRLRSKLRDKCEELSYHALSCANCNMADQLRGILGSRIEHERRRAERAEAIIYDEAMDHREHGFCDCPLCKFADAIAAAPDKPQYAALSPEPCGGPEGEE